MALLIDTPVWPWRGRLWSHLVSDVSYDELHAFVEAELGIPRRAFQGDHYDVPRSCTRSPWPRARSRWAAASCWRGCGGRGSGSRTARSSCSSALRLARAGASQACAVGVR